MEHGRSNIAVAAAAAATAVAAADVRADKAK